MKGRALTCLAWAALLLGCDNESPTAPPAPTTIIVNNTATNNNGGGTPGASPSPGTGGDLPAGSFNRIGLFGQSCPSGTTAPPNGLRQILLPCTGFVTATPKYADGSDIPAAVHGPNITWLVTFGQGVVNLMVPSEPFNRDVRCNSAGGFGLSAQVKNIIGQADFSCVTQASSSGVPGVSTQRVGDRVYFWNDYDEDGRPLATPELKRLAIERDQHVRSSTTCATCDSPGPYTGGGGSSGGGSGGGW